MPDTSEYCPCDVDHVWTDATRVTHRIMINGETHGVCGSCADETLSWLRNDDSSLSSCAHCGAGMHLDAYRSVVDAPSVLYAFVGLNVVTDETVTITNIALSVAGDNGWTCSLVAYGGELADGGDAVCVECANVMSQCVECVLLIPRNGNTYCGACDNDDYDDEDNGENFSRPMITDALAVPFVSPGVYVTSGRAFGVEVECDGGDMRDAMRTFNDAVRDGARPVLYSVHGEHCGSEFVMLPARGYRGEEALREVHRVLSEHGWTPNSDCGTHFHIDVNAETVSAVRRIIAGLRIIEPLIYAMTDPAAERETGTWARPSVRMWRKTIAALLAENDDDTVIGSRTYREWPETNSQTDRYCVVNAHSVPKHGTIEIRAMDGTFDTARILTLIGLCAGVADYCSATDAETLSGYLYPNGTTGAALLLLDAAVADGHVNAEVAWTATAAALGYGAHKGVAVPPVVDGGADLVPVLAPTQDVTHGMYDVVRITARDVNDYYRHRVAPGTLAVVHRVDPYSGMITVVALGSSFIDRYMVYPNQIECVTPFDANTVSRWESIGNPFSVGQWIRRIESELGTREYSGPAGRITARDVNAEGSYVYTIEWLNGETTRESRNGFAVVRPVMNVVTSEASETDNADPLRVGDYVTTRDNGFVCQIIGTRRHDLVVHDLVNDTEFIVARGFAIRYDPNADVTANPLSREITRLAEYWEETMNVEAMETMTA